MSSDLNSNLNSDWNNFNLNDLKITPTQLEKLTGLEISETRMGKVYRPSVFRSIRTKLSFLVSEALTLGLIMIFCLPLGLVIGRGFGLLKGDAASTVPFLWMTTSLSIGLFAGWQAYLWQKGKSLQTLAHLLDEVDKHNEIIAALSILDELEAIKGRISHSLDRGEIWQALTATRESLINALMTEKVLRKHQQFMVHRHELFANIETNLATLQTLQINDQASQYGLLLEQALQIGLSIRQELEQLER